MMIAGFRGSVAPLLAALMLCLVVSARDAYAQVTLSPSVIDSRAILTATIPIFAGCGVSSQNFRTVLTGAVVRTDVTVSGCVNVPAPDIPRTHLFGPLPAGSYTWQVYLNDGGGTVILLHQQTINVAEAAPLPLDAPTLGFEALAALALAVVAVAAVRLRGL